MNKSVCFFVGLGLLLAWTVCLAGESEVMTSLRVTREAEMVHQGHRFLLELEMPVWVYPEGRLLNESQIKEIEQLLKDLEDYVAMLQKLSRQAENLSARWSLLMLETTPFQGEKENVP